MFFIICLIYLLLTVVYKNEKQFKSVKKVRFNLDNNDVIIIPNNNKKSIVKDKVDFGKNQYGQNIIKNSNYFNEEMTEIPNIQKQFIESLDKSKLKSDEVKNIFKDQKPYWDSLDIDLNRSFDNYQVNNFNSIRNENIKGKEISNVYNDLTYSAGISKSNLLHHDNNILYDII